MKNWKKIAKQQAETIAELNMEMYSYEEQLKDKDKEIGVLNAQIDAIADIVNDGKRPLKLKWNYPNLGSGSITTTGGKYFYTINNATLPSEGYK